MGQTVVFMNETLMLRDKALTLGTAIEWIAAGKAQEALCQVQRGSFGVLCCLWAQDNLDLEGGFGWTEAHLRLTVQILDLFDASPASVGVNPVVGSQ